jgi:hypothetical protein
MKQKSEDNPSGSSPANGVYESVSHAPREENRQIELMLSNIITRLERIEEKIDDNVYPPESAIKPEFVRQVKKAEADIRKGKGKAYDSVEDFFKEIEA